MYTSLVYTHYEKYDVCVTDYFSYIPVGLDIFPKETSFALLKLKLCLFLFNTSA